jgi:hypothetical protein
MEEYPPDAIDMVMESLYDQFNFIKGLNILQKYALEYFEIAVINIGEISVSGCKIVSEEDSLILKKMGWEVWHNFSQNISRAHYNKLRYMED